MKTQSMQAIILAAGCGRRLAELNPQGLPKCLLEFGGNSLLARHLDLLYRCGIRQAHLVIGYEADRIIEHVGQLKSRPDVAFHFNPRYEQGSAISLRAVGDILTCGTDILLMDADVLYHPAILARLVDTRHPNCFLLDGDFEAGDEPVKIAVRDGTIVEFRKQLDPQLGYDHIGESVGFFRFDQACAAEIAAECERCDAEGLDDTPYEEVIRSLLLRNPESFSYEDITGLPWIEIDFPADVNRAREKIVAAIRSDTADF